MDNQPLDLSRQVYNAIQLLRDGSTSTYDNLLVVSISDVDEYSGQYGCSIRNSFGSVSEEATFIGNVNQYLGLNYSGIYTIKTPLCEQ